MDGTSGRAYYFPGIWTKATPSICWSRNRGKLDNCSRTSINIWFDQPGKPNRLTVNKDSMVKCDMCLEKVRFRNLEKHRNRRCQFCGHHHICLGRIFHCSRAIESCKRCNLSNSLLPSPNMTLTMIGRAKAAMKRCSCGHYHKAGYICSVSEPSSLGKVRRKFNFYVIAEPLPQKPFRRTWTEMMLARTSTAAVRQAEVIRRRQ